MDTHSEDELKVERNVEGEVGERREAYIWREGGVQVQGQEKEDGGSAVQVAGPAPWEHCPTRVGARQPRHDPIDRCPRHPPRRVTPSTSSLARSLLSRLWYSSSYVTRCSCTLLLVLASSLVDLSFLCFQNYPGPSERLTSILRIQCPLSPTVSRSKKAGGCMPACLLHGWTSRRLGTGPPATLSSTSQHSARRARRLRPCFYRRSLPEPHAPALRPACILVSAPAAV